MNVRRAVQTLTLSALLVVGTGVGGQSAAASTLGGQPAAASTPAQSCEITWGSLPKQGGSLRAAPLTSTRTGRHACFDRVVFEFRGKADGYRVSYVNAVPEEGTGKPLPVAGGAKLHVALYNPAYDANGRSTYPHASRDHVADVRGYRTLRDVVYGGSFEGYTTFGIGTRARLPFRVFVLPGPGNHSRIVVDVAHRW